MASKKGFPSLKMLAMTYASEMTLATLKHELQEEEAQRSRNRERMGNCKRKRSYSSGDQNQEGPKWHKRARIEVNTSPTEVSGKQIKKRQLEQDEIGINTSNKRLKLECKNYPISQKREAGEEMSKDDMSVRYSRTEDACHSLRKYFHGLPYAIWSHYGKTLINHALRDIQTEKADKKIHKKVIEYTFCEKLTSFSTQEIENYISELDGIVYKNLKNCTRLLSLELTMTPQGETDMVAATLSFQKLRLLQTLCLLPSDRYSFHWAVRDLTLYCQALKSLKLMYNGDLFPDTDDLHCLTRCNSLATLWLFNFGRRCETKQISYILRSLTNLKVLYHKELPNAILELFSENEKNTRGTVHGEEEVREGQVGMGEMLKLERVDLCWYQRGLGYQLVYVPSSYLMAVAQLCPKVILLNLVGPTCLAQVLLNLPNLQTLILQQASLISCLTNSLTCRYLSTLTELRVCDVWDVTHDLVSAMACGCPNLQVLSVINSSLEARGELVSPLHRSPFPCLQQAILVPDMLHGRPALTTPAVWQLGNDLTRYLLDNATKLTTLHLQYRTEDLAISDTPTQQDLEDVLSRPRPALCTLILECPPAASPSLVEVVTLACPALVTLGNITTWPLSPHQCASLIVRYGAKLNIS